jgi:hypothetical protein
MIRIRTRVVAAVLGALLGVGSAGTLVATPAGALPTTSQPQLVLDRLIRTSPFVGSSVSVRDNEGSAYVARDDSLWMVDDNSNSAYEIDRATGALRRRISEPSFANAPRLGVGTLATSSRDGDLEAVAYDATADVLYMESGSTGGSPTMFRLVRDGSGAFQVESWQPLASEFTAAGWRLADGRLYVAGASTIRTYDYAANALGTSFSIPGITGIFGLDFDDQSGDLVAVNTSQRLFRASMSTRTIVTGWNLDLTGFGIEDSRAVEVIGNQLFVSDGLDTRSSSDPKNHAIFVLDVGPRSVAVHLSSSEATRAAQLVNVFDAANVDDLLQRGVGLLAFLNALSPSPTPTPADLDPPGTAVTRTVTWTASALPNLEAVKVRWAVNDEDAHRLGFYLISFLAALSGQ